LPWAILSLPFQGVGDAEETVRTAFYEIAEVFGRYPPRE